MKTGYILTWSKTKFYPLEPRKEDIHIEDIAHALSMMTRANGHFSHFYSVAQHCVNCYREAGARGYSERVRLGCLLHDASEAYISDITRPVKQNLTQYLKIEEKLQGAIYEKFGLGDLTPEEKECIRAVDDGLLYTEFISLMDIAVFDEAPPNAMVHDLEECPFWEMEEAFLAAFRHIYKGK